MHSAFFLLIKYTGDKMKLIKYILFIGGIFLIILGIFLNCKINHSTNNKSLNGKWLEESGSLFVIKGDTFYWYKDYNDLTDNYYKGKVEYTSLDKAGYTKKYIKEKYGNIDSSLFYTIKLYPSYIKKENKKENIDSSYHLLFELLLEKDCLEGTLYNKNFLTIYKIIKYGD